jgi:DNA polymerase-1
MGPATPESYQLLHQGSLALGRAECQGIRIDMDVLDGNISKAKQQLSEIDGWQREQPEYKLQRRRFGPDTNPSSREQLGRVLYGDMGLPYSGTTGKKGQFLLDEERLQALGSPYTKSVIRRTKLEKALSTYLEGLKGEIVRGRVHPFYNLHNIKTYRSSCEGPNIQNQPVREQWLAELVRTVYVPDPDQVLVEIDYSGAEVIVAACYHKDPRMLEYLLSGYDLHAAMANEIWKLDTLATVPAGLKKRARQAAKGAFVFAEFYGDYWRGVAVSLWKETVELGLVDHMATMGLGNQQAFTGHIKTVEEKFWGQRFPVYDAWRQKWWRDFLQWGHCYTHTGFRIWGSGFVKNEVINSPIQGSSFHCLLASFIEIDRLLRTNGMRARLVGQVHDSILATVPRSEFAAFTALARAVMCDWLAKRWPWLIVPMKIDVEASDVSWYHKTKQGVGVPYVSGNN